MKYTPLFKTRRAVEEVLDKLYEIEELYGATQVCDLYELAGIPCTEEDKYRGWIHIRNAKVIKVGQYYVLDMPEIQELQ